MSSLPAAPSVEEERPPHGSSDPEPVELTSSRRRRRILGGARVPVLELLVVLIVLTVLAAAMYGSHVRDGGFLMDDWSNAAKTRFLAACCGTGSTGQGSGYLAQVQNLLADGPAAYHIGLPVLIPLSFFAFRPAIAPHLALAVALGVLVSACMYAVLRSFRVAPVHALAMSSLVLLFPWSDSNRLWAMASYNQLAVVLWLVGLLIALRGLRSSGRRALLLHGAALVFYAIGIAVYELVAGAVVITAAFYFHRDAGGQVAWRGMARRWVADLTVTALTLLAVVALALPRFAIPWDQRVAFAGIVVDEALTLLSFAAVPFAQPWRWLVAGLLVGVLVAGAVLRSRLPREDPEWAGLGQWLAVAAAGVLVVGAGYALALLGGYGRPLSAGIENRVNLISGAGYVMIVYASAALAAHLAVRATGRPPTWATAVPLVASLVIGIGYVGLGRESAAAYDRSFAEQLEVLHAIRDGGPYPPAALIFPFDYPSFTSVGVPVFAWIWDLPPASKIILDDPSPAAFPVLPETTFTCADNSVLPSNEHGLGEHHRGQYGNTFFVHVPTGRTVRIDSYEECQAAVADFQPGPLMEGRDCSLVAGGPATRVGWNCEDGPAPLMRP